MAGVHTQDRAHKKEHTRKSSEGESKHLVAQFFCSKDCEIGIFSRLGRPYERYRNSAARMQMPWSWNGDTGTRGVLLVVAEQCWRGGYLGCV